MWDLTLQQMVLRAFALTIVATAHGCALAALAGLLGEPGPRQDGRLTVNPAKQIDLIGLASAVLFQLGWSRPIDLDARHLRGGTAGAIVWLLGGAAAVLATGYLVQLLRIPVYGLLTDLPAAAALLIIAETARVAAWFALFSLLPIPPLAGAQILFALAPRLKVPASRLRAVWPVLALALAASGLFQDHLRPAQALLQGLIAQR